MRKPDPRYLVLWLFLFGIIIIVFLQVISGYNINRLIGGNKSLMNELQVQSDLRSLEVDLFVIESDVRGAVIKADERGLLETRANNQRIEIELQRLLNDLQSTIPARQLDSLKKLLQEKIQFNQLVLNSFLQ